MSFSRFCTKSSPGNGPLFFIGCSPSQAQGIINPRSPAAGVMISLTQLKNRRSDFSVSNWILDSGAFTEVARFGGYRSDVAQYSRQIDRWAKCGNLLIAVAQDFMCEPFVIERTGLSVKEHQRLTIERYDALIASNPVVPIMPVLQGYASADYLQHLLDYGDRLALNQWIGVGSVCRRNGKPDEILNILRGIKLLRPDLKLHGFGLKAIALENINIRNLLYSCDSMAWSFPLRFSPGGDYVQNRETLESLAHDYQEKIADRISDRYERPVSSTAGAGNGQGRKPKWASPTKAIRIPEKYCDRVLQLIKKWENEDEKI